MGDFGGGGTMGVVQGTSHPEHVVMDAESVSGHLLPPGSVYAFLAEHRRALFPVPDGRNGRRSRC
jgi:hypothetical protein